MKVFRFVLLFLLQISFSHANESVETWIIDKDVLEQMLPLDVTSNEIAAVLERENIKVCYQKKEKFLLWQGEKTQIILSSTPFAPYHLWISVNDKKNLEECTKRELTELYKAICISKKAIAEITGINSFLIFTTEQKRQCKENSFVGFEVIPISYNGDNSIMDAVEKDALNSYVFYNNYPIRKISNSPEIIEKLKERLKSFHFTFSKEKMLDSAWKQKLVHHKEALHQNLQIIYNTLVKNKALIKGQMPSLSEATEKIQEIQIDLDKCAFCNPNIIKNQIVCDWKDIYIIMNHKPTSIHGNFLILPKRHQCAWELNLTEAIASFEVIIALKKHLNETKGLNNWICYIQDGQSVGQTVPHTHIHFYIPPDPLKNAITILQHIHNQRPILSYEQMKYNCQKLQPLIIKQLQFFNKTKVIK